MVRFNCFMLEEFVSLWPRRDANRNQSVFVNVISLVLFRAGAIRLIVRNNNNTSVCMENMPSSFFGTTTVVGQGLPVHHSNPLTISSLLFYLIAGIVSPTVWGDKVHTGLEPMTGMLLGRAS